MSFSGVYPVRLAIRRPAPAVPRGDGGAARPWAWQAVQLALVAGLLAALVRAFDAPLVLAGLGASLFVLLLLMKPESATLLTFFLLYANVPVVASREHGVPAPVAAASMGLLLIPLAHAFVVRGERPRADSTFCLMVLFGAVLAASSLVVVDPGIALDRLATYALEGLAVYWLTINVVRSLATLKRVIWTVLLAGSLLGGLSLYQEVTGSYAQTFGGLAKRKVEVVADEDPGERSRPRVLHASDRARGPMDEPNRYAQILIVLLPLAACMYRVARTRRARLGACAAGALVLAGVLMSYSRGAFIALALLCVVALAIRWIRPLHLVAAAVLLAASVPVVAPRYYARIATMGTLRNVLDRQATAQPDGAIRGRLTEMLAGLQVFADHPVIGVGPGQYAPFYSVEYQQKNPNFNFRDLWITRRAHSLYIELGAETGIVGLTTFMAIVLLPMIALWRARRRLAHAPELAALATAFPLSLLAYLLTAGFMHLSYIRYYWFLVALAGAALLVIRAHDAAHAAGPGGGTAVGRTRGRSIAKRDLAREGAGWPA